MHLLKSKCLLGFLALFAFQLPLCADETIKAPSTNIQFPKEVHYKSDDGQDIVLHATGVATRSKFFVNVYSIAHYMRHPVEGRRSTVFEEILTDNQAKQVSLRWVRDIDLSRMRDGLHDSIDIVLSKDPANVDEEVELFLSFFRDSIQAGDEHVIRWLPGGVVELEVNGEVAGEVKSPEFARALWGVWFGPKSVVSRNRLIAFIKGK